jgi:hypothetical protein
MLRTAAIVTLGVVLFACAGATDERPAPTVGGFESSPSPLPMPTEVHPFYRPGGKEDSP